MHHLKSPYFFSAVSRERREKRIPRRPRYNRLPNGNVPTAAANSRKRTSWNSEIVPRQPWAPHIEDYRHGSGVVDREPVVYYRDPGCPGCVVASATDSDTIQFQRDIPQASSSSRRQCECIVYI